MIYPRSIDRQSVSEHSPAGYRFLKADTPQGIETNSPIVTKAEIDIFNDELRYGMEEFTSENMETSMEMFSSDTVLNSILDTPRDYGFKESDVVKEGGMIWEDGIHLSDGAMEVLGREMRVELQEYFG